MWGRTRLFLLVGELGLANLVATQDDVEHALHSGQDLLVGRSSAALEVGDDRRGGVALGGQVLLRHGRSLVVLRLRSCLLNRITDLSADGLGLHDVVRTVDLGQVLALNSCAL